MSTEEEKELAPLNDCETESSVAGAGEPLNTAQVSSEISRPAEERTPAPAPPNKKQRTDQKTNSDQAGLGWILSDSEHSNFEANTSLAEEIHRIRVLNSFNLLDQGNEEALDTLTSMGARMFDVPVCVVSLVDLGRIWFASNQGLGEVKELPRKNTICSYAISVKSNIFVVPDADLDERFKCNAEVASGPKIRFYAAAALLSPEGCRLGNYFICDTKPRPQGLTEKEQLTLQDFAAMTVRIMVDRRHKLSTREKRDQLLAYTAHDLMTPLTGLQLSLTLLKHETVQCRTLTDHQTELIETAERCSDVIGRICQTSFAELREDTDAGASIKRTSEAGPKPKCKLSDVVNSLHKIMAPIPKKVPFMISIGDTPPDLVVYDDLNVFRAALHFVTTACSRTVTGSVHLHVRIQDDKLLLECQDSAPHISASDCTRLFKHEESKGLQDSSLASLYLAGGLVSSIGGECGFRPRDFSADELMQPADRRRTGSVFWFSVPLGLQTAKRSDANTAAVSLKESFALSDEIDAGKALANDSKAMLPPSPTYESGKVPSPTMIFNDAVTSCEPREAFTLGPASESGSKVSAKPKGKPVATSGSPQARLKKVLVIDDSLVVRKALGRTLSNMGFEVTLAENGMEGLKKLQATVFDFCLCDFFMPVMDGLDCVKQYREWEMANLPTFRQHIVGISGHAGHNDMVLGSKLGMDDFKAKPVTASMLEELAKSEVVTCISRYLDNLVADPWEPSNRDGADKKRKATWPAHSGSSASVCLLAMSDSAESIVNVKKLELNGWKVEVVHDSESAMSRLQGRNWDAVLLDEDLNGTAAADFVKAFRNWEAENRVSRQNHVFLLSSMCEEALSDESVLVQVPFGFDAALPRSVRWEQFERLVQRDNQDGISFSPLNRIITR